jgi:hypothetical protein
MPTKRVLRLLSVAAIAPLLLSSCDSSRNFDPFEDAAGTYELTVYAGSSVPITFNCDPGECGLSNGGTFRVNDGTLVLFEDGEWTETNHYTMTPNGGSPENVDFSSSGTYEIFGDDIELFAPPQNGFPARFLDGTFVYGGNDVRIRYEEDNESYEYRR